MLTFSFPFINIISSFLKWYVGIYYIKSSYSIADTSLLNVSSDRLERIVLHDCITVHTNSILWSEVGEGKTWDVSIWVPDHAGCLKALQLDIPSGGHALVKTLAESRSVDAHLPHKSTCIKVFFQRTLLYSAAWQNKSVILHLVVYFINEWPIPYLRMHPYPWQGTKSTERGSVGGTGNTVDYWLFQCSPNRIGRNHDSGFSRTIWHCSLQ